MGGLADFVLEAGDCHDLGHDMMISSEALVVSTGEVD